MNVFKFLFIFIVLISISCSKIYDPVVPRVIETYIINNTSKLINLKIYSEGLEKELWTLQIGQRLRNNTFFVGNKKFDSSNNYPVGNLGTNSNYDSKFTIDSLVVIMDGKKPITHLHVNVKSSNKDAITIFSPRNIFSEGSFIIEKTYFRNRKEKKLSIETYECVYIFEESDFF
jgi:hypothetical protein